MKEMNDLGPIAVTYVLMKCLEKYVLKSLLSVCLDCLDLFQFAYRAERGVGDDISLFTGNIYKHLDAM